MLCVQRLKLAVTVEKKAVGRHQKYAAEVGAADSLFLAIEDKESDEYETGYRQTLAALAKNPEIDSSHRRQ